uniref:Uncharacterized protein n=1 Tax=Romanomermis culicivorax TaxID=13658 RepID=A0A915JSS7_ROMCU
KLLKPLADTRLQLLKSKYSKEFSNKFILLKHQSFAAFGRHVSRIDVIFRRTGQPLFHHFLHLFSVFDFLYAILPTIETLPMIDKIGHRAAIFERREIAAKTAANQKRHLTVLEKAEKRRSIFSTYIYSIFDAVLVTLLKAQT